MKKQHLFVSVVLLLVVFASCKKLIEAVFPGEDITMETLKITVPPIPVADSTAEVALGSFTTYINTDSIIRANTGGVFGINSIASVKVKTVTISASNTDASNNLSAFKSFRIAIASDTKTEQTNIIGMEIPASATNSYSASPDNSPDITGYLKGTSITYWIYGSVRHTTTKSLNLSYSIVMRVN